MKKILAIFFVIVAACALFACGRNKNTTAPITTPTTQTQNTTAHTSEMATSGTHSTTGTTDSHPTGTSGTTASQNARGGTMPNVSTTPPTGTAPGGSTSVR